ncbi:hypothetical protein Vretifemale_19674, partial [Volvox reticuliferus]
MTRHGARGAYENRDLPGAAVRVSIGECLASGLFAFISLLCYQQLAAPHCAGQPHTLPPDSALLIGYPCDGNAIKRMTYIFRHSPMVLWDICHVKFEDVWAASGLLMICVRFFATLLVPAPFYCQVLAPFTVYYARFVNTAFHILQGPRYKPTYLGLQSLFSKHASFDVAFFISLLCVTHVNMALELAYCAWATVATAILWYWYRDAIPGISFQGQMMTRLLVTLANIYLDRLLSRRNHHRGFAGLGRSSGAAARYTIVTTTAATAAAATAASDSAASGRFKAAAAAVAVKEEVEYVGGEEEEEEEVLETPFPCGGGSSISADAVKCENRTLPPAGPIFLRHPKPPAAPSAIHSSTTMTLRRNSSGSGGNTGGNGNGNSNNNVGGGSGGSCTTISTAHAAEKEGTAPTRWPLGGAAPAPTNTATAAVTSPAPSAGLQADGNMVALVPHIPYRSPFRRHAVWVKIPWAEPEQMDPHFEQRLQTLVSERGLQLTGAYVRRGCVELMMVLEEMKPPQPPPMPLVPSPRPSPLTPSAAVGSPACNTGAWHLDPAVLVQALGLAPRESKTEWQGLTNGDGLGGDGDGSCTVSSRGRCGGAWVAQQQLLQSIIQEDRALLTREAAMQGAAENIGTVSDYVIVTGLEPQVVSMTSSPPPAAAAAASRLPVLRLSVAACRRLRVQQRTHHHHQEEEEAGRV